MLPRVGSALAKFIAPISSSQTQGKHTVGHQEGESHSENSPKKRPQKKPESKPENKKDERISSDFLSGKKESQLRLVESSSSTSVANAFLQIINYLQLQRGSLVRWFGSHAYGRASRMQKKGAKFRKGTMFDEKAE